MKTNQIVYPSSQIDSVLPGYIVENYQRFVEFMSEADHDSERIGFGQDILQNLQKYRNFDTYKNQIVQFGTLNKNISELTTNWNWLTLMVFQTEMVFF